MKYNNGVELLFSNCAIVMLMLLTGCISTQNLEPNLDSKLERAFLAKHEVQIAGYIVFYGEFRLYESSYRFLGKDKKCVSGAFPLKMQNDMAQKFNKKYVTVTARVMEWPSSIDLVSIDYEGTPIQNGCLDSYVLFATEIELLRRT